MGVRRRAEGAESGEAVGADGVREVVFCRFGGLENIPMEVGEGVASKKGLEDEFCRVEGRTGLLGEGEAGEVGEAREDFREEQEGGDVEV